jgi:hypothetical protein
MEDLFAVFDTLMEKIATELRFINRGAKEYYIANILDKNITTEVLNGKM